VRTPPVILVEWDDAWSDRHHVLAGGEHYHQEYPMRAVGFLHHEGDRIVVCRAWSPGHDDEESYFSDCISIPRSLVQRVRQARAWQDHELTPPDKPVKRRRRRKARPPAEVPPAALGIDSDEVDPPESTTLPEEGE